VDGIMIYTIGFPTEETVHVSHGALTGPGGQPVQGGTRTKVKKPDGSLKDLASDTGGGYFEFGPLQPLSATFARIADELHRQYWLGFKPHALDGESHTIDVKVKRKGL